MSHRSLCSTVENYRRNPAQISVHTDLGRKARVAHAEMRHLEGRFQGVSKANAL